MAATARGWRVWRSSMNGRSTMRQVRMAVALLALCACSSSDDKHETSCPAAMPMCIASSPATGNAGSASLAGAGGTIAPPITASGGAGGMPSAGGSGGASAAGSAGSAMTMNAGTTAPPATDAGSAGTAGTDVAGSSATGGMGGSPSSGMQVLPPIDDYGAMGPFTTMIANSTGPDGTYTIFRPNELGKDGFLHPPTTWGNGITTTPAQYTALLSTIASHGFAIIASNSSNVTADLMTKGLDWLIAQNEVDGDFKGKLDVERAVSIGYSLGGGAAVGAGSHEKVVVTVSMHGLTGASNELHGPLLLFTSTGDTFVSAAQFVDPTFNMSRVQTFYGTLTGGSHLNPLGDAGDERAPMIAWLRLWVYGDEGAKKYFYGDDCTLCKAPWVMPQRKNWP
jgi:hypothetical protein